jgi:hypothetical protein
MPERIVSSDNARYAAESVNQYDERSLAQHHEQSLDEDDDENLSERDEYEVSGDHAAILLVQLIFKEEHDAAMPDFTDDEYGMDFSDEGKHSRLVPMYVRMLTGLFNRFSFVS